MSSAESGGILAFKDGAERPSDKLGRPIVAAVQTAQAIMEKCATRGYAASSAPRCSLSQSNMRTVFVMVGDVLGKQPLQMRLVESNHRVEQLTSAAPNPALGNAILPGPRLERLHGGNDDVRTRSASRQIRPDRGAS